MPHEQDLQPQNELNKNGSPSWVTWLEYHELHNKLLKSFLQWSDSPGILGQCPIKKSHLGKGHAILSARLRLTPYVNCWLFIPNFVWKSCMLIHWDYRQSQSWCNWQPQGWPQRPENGCINELSDRVTSMRHWSSRIHHPEWNSGC